MDKQTLSQYGWVVICVLVLAVLIGMATPFGNAIKGSVNDIVTVMDDSAESKLNTAFVDAGYGSDESEYETDKVDWFSKIGDTSGSFWNEKGEVVYTTAQMAEDYPGDWDRNCDYDAIALKLIDTYGIVACGLYTDDFNEDEMQYQIIVITDAIFRNVKIQLGDFASGGEHTIGYTNSIIDLGITFAADIYNGYTIYTSETSTEAHQKFLDANYIDGCINQLQISEVEELKSNISNLKIVYSDGVIDTPTSLLKNGYIKWVIINDNGDVIDTVEF